MQTFAEFKTRLRAEIWPGGEARSLRAAHDPFFNEAMMKLQRYVACLKQFNVSTWDFEDTHWHNGRTVVNAPHGKIKKVYTVAGGDDRWRDQVRYRSTNFQDIECWSNALRDAITPTDATLPALSFGFKRADSSGDSPVGRARIGAWAVDRRRLYVAPYIQSTETLVVEWDGDKDKWQDSDGVDEEIWGIEEESAIKLFVLWKDASIFQRDRAAAKDFEEQWEQALADIIHKCHEYTRQQEDTTCGGGIGDGAGIGGAVVTHPDDDDIDDDDDPVDDPTEADEVLFNAVGDLGDDNDDTAEVAAKVIADNPEFFIALGDLTYNDDFAADFDERYSSLMVAGKLVPVPGNHDVIGGNLNAFKEHFADFIDPNGEANYEFVHGPIHILVYNSEDSGNINSTSAQAEWLRVKLMLSTARWKIVVLHKPPYSSDISYTPGISDLRLAFAEWGADAVICAHAHSYERLEVDGIPHFIVGTGGHSMRGFSTPIAQSQFRYNTKFGRLVVEGDCDEMIFRFKNVDDEIVDTLTLTKD